MHNSIQNVCNSLDNISEIILNGWNDNRILTEVWGWNFPSMTRQDLAGIGKNLSSLLKQANIENLDDQEVSIIDTIPTKLSIIQSHTIPHFYNGQGNQAIPLYLATIDWIRNIFNPIIGWQAIVDNKLMPNQITKKLRSINAELNSILPDKNNLESKISLINNAHDVAESLPIDMEILSTAKEKIERYAQLSDTSYSKLSNRISEIDKLLVDLQTKKTETDKLVAQCEEAYRITTTKGLAGAFDQRAKKLNQSIVLWVIGLLIALATGAIIGSQRINTLTESFKQPMVSWGIVIVQALISLLSVGAPIWFAWLATKQITQRFRLAEDYSFKASISKAYEGYRREAARLDQKFEAQLFGSALSRLDEAPLRLVENDTHGSPYHELFQSKSFQQALKKIPELKNDLLSIAKTKAKRQPNDNVVETE